MLRVIDPHIHLIDLQQGRYDWLKEVHAPHWPDKAKIRRDFSEADLVLETSAALAGFVHIEAGFDNESPWRELAWLERHCQLPFKSVAFADLTSTDFPAQLARLTAFSSLVGIRYILDENAGAILANELVRQHLRLLSEQGLMFEAQLPLAVPSAADALNQVLLSLPRLKVVVNHCGSAAQLSEHWMNGIMRLAQHPECAIKCSGWEMFDAAWSRDEIKPMVSFLIGQFGLPRVMLASNFPVSEMACSYAEVWSRYLNEMDWSPREKEMLVYKNAKRIYQFS